MSMIEIRDDEDVIQARKAGLKAWGITIEDDPDFDYLTELGEDD